MAKETQVKPIDPQPKPQAANTPTPTQKSEPKKEVKKKEEDKKTNVAVESVKKEKKPRSPWSSFIFIFIVDLICLGLLFFMLNLVSTNASELKRYRNASLAAEQQGKAEISDLQNKGIMEKSDKLKSVFPKDEGLVNFVKELEAIKAQEGAFKAFSFASDVAVRDKTGIYGIPLLLEFSGSWGAIDTSLQQIQKLPYLLRGVTVNAKFNTENVEIIEFKYGGLLYVDESLGKNQ